MTDLNYPDHSSAGFSYSGSRTSRKPSGNHSDTVPRFSVHFPRCLLNVQFPSWTCCQHYYFHCFRNVSICASYCYYTRIWQYLSTVQENFDKLVNLVICKSEFWGMLSLRKQPEGTMRRNWCGLMIGCCCYCCGRTMFGRLFGVRTSHDEEWDCRLGCGRMRKRRGWMRRGWGFLFFFGTGENCSC